MNSSPSQFADLLTQSLNLIKIRSRVNLQILQDEVAYALGRDSGEYVRFLRKKNVPSVLSDLEHLAVELYQRNGFDTSAEIERFLRYGGHPQPKKFVLKLNGKDELPSIEPSSLTLKPFVAGPPIIKPSQFFGRQHELTYILNRWAGFPLEHIAVIGPRCSGKSSLLHYIRSMICSDIEKERCVVPPSSYLTKQSAIKQPVSLVFIDFHDVRMRQQESLLKCILEGMNLPVSKPCTLNQFLEVIVKKGLLKPTIILMDNITLGLQSSTLDKDFWWGMQSLASHQSGGNLAFLVTSSESPIRIAARTNKPSPLFDIFQILELGALAESEVLKLLDSAPYPFKQADKEWILLQGKCWPHPTQFMCQILHERLMRGEPVDGWREEALRLLALFRGE